MSERVWTFATEPCHQFVNCYDGCDKCLRCGFGVLAHVRAVSTPKDATHG